tara:strand:- start:1459 stop:1887 length:429 start_codon:yes stop_codon:yes gene_type:complete
MLGDLPELVNEVFSRGFNYDSFKGEYSVEPIDKLVDLTKKYSFYGPQDSDLDNKVRIGEILKPSARLRIRQQFKPDYLRNMKEDRSVKDVWLTVHLFYSDGTDVLAFNPLIEIFKQMGLERDQELEWDSDFKIPKTYLDRVG